MTYLADRGFESVGGSIFCTTVMISHESSEPPWGPDRAQISRKTETTIAPWRVWQNVFGNHLRGHAPWMCVKANETGMRVGAWKRGQPASQFSIPLMRLPCLASITIKLWLQIVRRHDSHPIRSATANIGALWPGNCISEILSLLWKFGCDPHLS